MIVRIVIGTVVGASVGALLGSTRSCAEGGCPLTANPKRGAVWGGLIGLFMALAAAAP
jgi:outer membrane lipoprotein SlyB